MNQFVFSTSGDWESTTLTGNGEDISASILYLHIQSGRDEYGQPSRGGVNDGGDIECYYILQDTPNQQQGIFPGRLEMNFPGHTLIVENTHPTFAFEYTSIDHNGRDVRNNIVEALVNIDSINNQVQAFITLYKAHWLGQDEVATFTLL